MEQALNAVFPNATLQTCIVHLIRNSLEYVSWKERREVAATLKPVYTAPPSRLRWRSWRLSSEGHGVSGTPRSPRRGAAPGIR